VVAPRRATAVALAGVMAMGAAGCGSGSSGDSSSNEKTRDLKILSRALSRENTIIAAAAAAGGTLHGEAGGRGIALLRSAETHTAYLTKAVRKLGGTPHQPRRDYADQVAGRRTQAALVALLSDMAGRVAAADARAAPRVSDDDFRGLTQAVAVSDRRHAEALARLRAD
jgi:hypothetical protein